MYLRPILLQRSWLTNYVLRWHIHENFSNIIFSSDELDNDNIKIIDIFLILLLLFSKIFRRSLLGVKFQFTEENILAKNKIAYMGYFQNLDLYDTSFWKYVSELTEKLKISLPVDRTVIHMRFGDSVWALENNTYYEKIKSLLSIENEKIYFVSDDHTRCEEFASSLGVDYVLFKSDMISEFKFLAESKVCICAPSTFSWWASIINLKEKDRIYMPLFFKERFKLKSSALVFL